MSERADFPSTNESLESLANKESILRDIILANITGHYREALADPDRFIQAYREIDFGVPVHAFRMDSLYMRLREGERLEPNHLTIFVPASEVESGEELRKVWAEWDMHPRGKWSVVIDADTARYYDRRASAREAEQQAAAEIAQQKVGGTAEGQDRSTWEHDDILRGIYDNLQTSLEILHEFHEALLEEHYILKPFDPTKA